MLDNIDVYKQLEKQDSILQALEGKRLSAKDWINEIVSQMYALVQICYQQQEEIDKLKKSLND